MFTMLRNARKFYKVYSSTIQQAMPAEFKNDVLEKIRQTLSAKSYPFTLSCINIGF